MSWSEERSNERIKARDFDASEVTVSKLSRERNFENIGPKEAVETDSVHIYLDLVGFQAVVAEAREDKYRQKRALRALNVLHKMYDELNGLRTDAAIIQYQSHRVHGLVFKPYDDEAKRAINSVAAAIDFLSFVPIFNEVFGEELGHTMTGAVGMAAGKTYIINIGRKGNRELLSLGGPASRGAKNTHGQNQITVCERIYQLLPVDLKNLFQAKHHCERDVFIATGLTWEIKPDLQKQDFPEFSREKILRKTLEYKDAINLDDIDISGANEKIDFDGLSDITVKRMDSLSMYADLDGFTSYMDGLKTPGDAKEMVRLFHGIRSELEQVMTCDYADGLKVQQRGDCLLGNFHTPSSIGDASKRSDLAVEAAVALASSMTLLNEYFKKPKRFDLQIGVSSGSAFFARVGKRGDRTAVTIGRSIDLAEALQQSSEKNEIRICEKTYNRLPSGVLKEQFKVTSDGSSYLARNLSIDRLVELEDKSLTEAAFQRVAKADVVAPGFFHVGVAANSESHPHVNTVPHLARKQIK